MKCFTLLLVLIFSSSSVYTQWQLQNSGTTENLNDVVVLNQTTSIVVADNGFILKTTNNGLNWVTKDGGRSFNFNAVSFLDEQNGIAVGDEVICRTTDGGETWFAGYFYKNCVAISYRYCAGNSNVILGRDDGEIYFSSNSGYSWSGILNFPEGPIIAVGFNCVTTGFPIAYAATNYHTAVNFSFPSNE